VKGASKVRSKAKLFMWKVNNKDERRRKKRKSNLRWREVD